MSTVRLPPKKDVAIALLQKSSIYIHLDPRSEDVRVPPWLKQRVPLVLQVGLNMAVAIPDLDVGDDAISCTLSFQRRPHFCYIPWASVYALVGEDQRGMVWPDDVPREVAAQAQKNQQVQKRRSSLRAVPGESEQPTGEKKESSPQDDTEGSEDRVTPPALEEPRASESKGKKRLSIAPAPEPDGPREPEVSAEPQLDGDSSDARKLEDDEPPTPSKKGRSLPPYLRVVK